MAADTVAQAGHEVSVFEAKPTAARKFLMAGKSGLNLTHAESHEAFRTRFTPSPPLLQRAIDGFAGEDVRAWAAGLGIETFVGSSGRVFPTAMKGSPLLRAWLRRLDAQDVRIVTRHRWIGFEESDLAFETPDGIGRDRFDAVILALGGASWPRLGSDAAWVPWLVERGVAVTPFRPANCGFEVDWSEHFVTRFAGTPVKGVVATSARGDLAGEFVVSRYGVEGSLIYAHAMALRDELERAGRAALTLDLTPGRSAETLSRRLLGFDRKVSLSNRLRKGAGLDPVKVSLLRELAGAIDWSDGKAVAAAIKGLVLPVTRPRPIAEAISSAGGVSWSAIDDRFMLESIPGVFVCGEMIDWEAPTGGYLLSACMATGRAAGEGAIGWLESQPI
jgi:uncharacterized flavoprotein (TIGR03862 family)